MAFPVWMTLLVLLPFGCPDSGSGRHSNWDGGVSFQHRCVCGFCGATGKRRWTAGECAVSSVV
eukprot:18795-Chlamydomonas_euryale.AAC.1